MDGSNNKRRGLPREYRLDLCHALARKLRFLVRRGEGQTQHFGQERCGIAEGLLCAFGIRENKQLPPNA